MPAFVYPGSQDTNGSPDLIRDDLVEAHREAWRHVALPGTWLTGAERVAVAAETRSARGCTLCAERKAALSPFAIEGEHDSAGASASMISSLLSLPMIDGIHRVTTDPSRLTQDWLRSLLDQGLSVESYVEALGVAALVISVDEFHNAMGLALEPLPAPEAGEPTRRRPNGVSTHEAWVPMIDPRRADPEERRLLAGPGGRSPYVIRALSLVPDEVRAWNALASGQYLSLEKMSGMETGRAIDRSQIELVAGRVSALNECFY